MAFVSVQGHVMRTQLHYSLLTAASPQLDVSALGLHNFGIYLALECAFEHEPVYLHDTDPSARMAVCALYALSACC